MTQHWLATIDVKTDRRYWVKRNCIVEGDIGLWYADYLQKQQCPYDFRFVGAVPISEEGAAALRKEQELARM